MKWAKACIQRIMRLLFGKYTWWHVRAIDLAGYPQPKSTDLQLGPITSAAQQAGTVDPSMRRYPPDPEGGIYVFGAWVDDELASVVIIKSYKGSTRSMRMAWPLKDDEGGVSQLTTEVRFRGQGIAPRLLDYACHKMSKLGLSRLIATIWLGNTASMRAFDKAGWSHVAFHVVLFPFHRAKPLSIIRWKDKAGIRAHFQAGNI